MKKYAARPPACRAYALEGGAIEGNAADDALMVEQGGNGGGFTISGAIFNRAPKVKMSIASTGQVMAF